MRLTPDKKLHSREHVLAEDLSQMMHEPKRFAGYLGIAQRYHESDLRALSRYVREKEGLPLEAYGKYFFASLKGLAKKNLKKHAKKQTKHDGDRKRAGKSAPKKSG